MLTFTINLYELTTIINILHTGMHLYVLFYYLPSWMYSEQKPIVAACTVYPLPVNRLSSVSPLSGSEQNISGQLICSNQIISKRGGPENPWWIFNCFDEDSVTGREIHWLACEGELATCWWGSNWCTKPCTVRVTNN